MVRLFIRSVDSRVRQSGGAAQLSCVEWDEGVLWLDVVVSRGRSVAWPRKRIALLTFVGGGAKTLRREARNRMWQKGRRGETVGCREKARPAPVFSALKLKEWRLNV